MLTRSELPIAFLLPLAPVMLIPLPGLNLLGSACLLLLLLLLLPLRSSVSRLRTLLVL